MFVFVCDVVWLISLISPACQMTSAMSEAGDTKHQTTDIYQTLCCLCYTFLLLCRNVELPAGGAAEALCRGKQWHQCPRRTRLRLQLRWAARRHRGDSRVRPRVSLIFNYFIQVLGPQTKLLGLVMNTELLTQYRYKLYLKHVSIARRCRGSFYEIYLWGFHWICSAQAEKFCWIMF